MSDDDLSDLKALMGTATPAPDPAKKQAHIRLAEKNFDDLQGSRDDTRLTFDRPKSGLFRGVNFMMQSLSNRGALAATTALAAVGLVVLLPTLSEMPNPGVAVIPVSETLNSEAGEQAARLRATDELTVREEPALEPHELADMQEAAPAQEPVPVVRTGHLARKQAPASPTAGLNAQDTYMIAPDEFRREADTEAYPDATPNPVRSTDTDPVSTFSIDVDTASYGVVRSSLMNGILPPKNAVRIEEMVNYFPYAYPAPEPGQAFRPTVTVTDTPWNPDTQIVHFGIQGTLPAIEDRPPLNLVFLIDTSGSMDQPNKLPLLKQSFLLMLSQLRPEDEVAIVTYAGSAGQVLKATPARESAKILAALDRLGAGGSTAGQAGLQQAYAVAAAMSDEGDVSRVILATDGDFNVGLSNPDALKSFISKKRDSGTYLSVLGFGRGNLDDATMQALAQNGNGTAAYIDTLQEAQKVLVDQLSGALFPIADDVKIQIEFNPAEVAEYRLIGYETRALKREDFNNDKVDAGDIGAGHTVTALYEITPVGSPAILNDPLRYQPAQSTSESGGELGWFKLRYKAPGDTSSQLIEAPIVAGGKASGDMRFAMAIAGFGQLLTGGSYLGDWGWDQAIDLAAASRGADTFGYRGEALRLMRLAQALSAN